MFLLDISNNDKGQLLTNKSPLANGFLFFLFLFYCVDLFY